jgi:hypothetical protein
MQEMAGNFLAQTLKAFLGSTVEMVSAKSPKTYDEILPTEHNPRRIEIKMNPTRIAEKGWEDSYKLAKLLQ